MFYFGEDYKSVCGNCDNCLIPPKTWDGTLAAQKALSTVYRTGQRFGVVHLIDVLLGKTTERVQQFGHDRLSTFGVGRDLTELAWRGVFRQLAATGLLAVDVERFGGLKLTAESRNVLKGGQTVTFRVEEVKKAARKTAKVGSRDLPSGGRAGKGSVKQEDERLWEALREERLKFSREQNVPPYVIFHDATLLDMLKRRPKDLAEFATIGGVGTHKLERYGKAFLAVLAAHW